MAAPLHELVLAQIAVDFPRPQRSSVASELARYSGRERARVQIAILKLAAGELDLVSAYVGATQGDYRDVLLWADPEDKLMARVRKAHRAPPDRPTEVRAQLRSTDTTDLYQVAVTLGSPALWPLEAEHLPLVIEQYRRTRYWQGRAGLLYHVTGLAPTHDAAIELGIEALGDRSLEVRYRACGLLAYGGHPEAAPHLAQLARGADEQTAQYARAALEALSARNLAPFTALDTPRRRFYFLPCRNPCRAPWPTFAEEFDASARPWLAGLGFAPQSVFQHDAFYRAGDLWFHACWEQWDVLWMFFLGPRDKLSSFLIGEWLRRAGRASRSPRASRART